MRICAGIITWQDGDALRNAIRSVEDVVDEIVIADGLIDGIDAIWHTADGSSGVIPPLSDRLDIDRAAPHAHVAQRRWASQSAQRQCTLDMARSLDCDWLLAIDADEELRNRSALRPWLEAWRFDAFPVPFYFTDEHAAHPAAFKCLHIPHWRRYVAQGSILENTHGDIVQVNGQNLWVGARDAGMPYLVHRPELRPEWRQHIRLSEHEVALEPYPENVKAWVEPVYAPALLAPEGLLVDSLIQARDLGLPVWYCPACGRRYGGPGSCSLEHATTGLERLEVAA